MIVGRAIRSHRVRCSQTRLAGHRDPNNIERDHRRVRRGTPFEWVVPHTYRKTVATMLDRQSLSARTIADRLGHARISMTQDVYMGRRAVDQAARCCTGRRLHHRT